MCRKWSKKERRSYITQPQCVTGRDSSFSTQEKLIFTFVMTSGPMKVKVLRQSRSLIGKGSASNVELGSVWTSIQKDSSQENLNLLIASERTIVS